MKTAFYFNDQGFSGLDLSNPLDGNNGIGGTHYCFLTVAASLIMYFKNLEITFYHYNDNKLPDGIRSVMIKSGEDAVQQAESDDQDIFIYRADGNIDFINTIAASSLKCIAWAHNYIFSDELKSLTDNERIVRILFVGKEEYDRYIDHDAIDKSTFIYNIFDGKRFSPRQVPSVPSVTYTGSLVKAKGFHILAKIWKGILKEVPDAQLNVIGSGQLYNRKEVLGSLGIADKKYEDEFAPYLMEDGKLLPSVHFCGNMGIEKLDIYMMTTVGVMNPSGRTETFGLSAVEMEACAIPVVTKASNGLFDTVIDEQTGYLISNESELRKRIVKLLKDTTLNNQMGIQAKEFVEEAFDPNKIATEWFDLFSEISEGKPCRYQKPTGHYINNAKWLRIAIRWLRRHHIPVKPLIDVECWVKKKLRG